MSIFFSNELQEGMEGRYRVSLAWRYETVEFLGLPYLSDERPLTLQEIYVPLSLTRQPGSTERVYVPEALEQQRHLVVLGDPGTGKSTLVKLLAYSFGRIEPTPLARRFGPHLPIPIILRDYRVQQWQSPEDMLRDFIAQLDDEVRSAVTVDWLLAALLQGKGILLLDGLDEVGGREERQRLRDTVVSPLLQRMPDSLAVLTSRIVGYDEVAFGTPLEALSLAASPFEGQPCYLAPFNDEEIEQFISRWYTARERDEQERRRRLASLREALQRSDRIRRLAGNPSLLTLMALIHRVTADLPSGRVKLYEKIVEAYLETIQRYRGLIPYEASLEQMKRWLAEVGWAMQSRYAAAQQGELLVSRQEVLTWLEHAIQRDRDNPTEESERFLEYIARRSGLLIPRGPEQFAFVHLTFQEYFAAWHLRGLLRRFDTLVETCATLTSNERWHETLVLLFELLAEFPEAGDDLVEALQQRAQDQTARSGTVKLFAELLLDEQSGLSRSRQEQAAHFVLVTTCASYSEAAVARLQQLAPERLRVLVYPWLDERLQQAVPRKIGPDFFLVLARFDAAERWAEQLETWVIQRGHLEWNEQHIVDIVTLGSDCPAVCIWAVERLPWHVWFGDAFDNSNLIDVCIPTLVLIQPRSARYRLLTQLGMMYAINRSHIIPHVFWGRSMGPDNKLRRRFRSVTSRAVTRALAKTRPQVGTLAGARAAADAGVLAQAEALLAGAEVLAQAGTTRVLARVEALTRALARTLARTLAASASASVSPPTWLTQQASLATTVAWAEWLVRAPDFPPEAFQTHIEALQGLCEASDDWTRLSGLTGLMLLGDGTPERCAARNALLDHGMQQPASFTFPQDVREVTDTPEFQQELPGLLRQIFLHEPGDPWLQPEWFDPAHPAARFFRARPRELFARAAEVLDPEGKTGLAQWRQTGDVSV